MSVILMILKIIGLTLILLLLMILFVSIRYKIVFKFKDKDIYANISFCWTIFNGKMLYKDKTLDYCVRILWVKLIPHKSKKSTIDVKTDVKDIQYAKDSKVENSTPQKKITNNVNTIPETKDTKADIKKRFRLEYLNPSYWYYRLTTLYFRIEHKISKLINDITNPEYKEALKCVLEEIVIILKHILPRKHKINLQVGFKDPSLTGELLGLCSVIKAMAGVNINLIPDFDNEIIECDSYFIGRIRVINILITLFRLYKNKTINKLIRRR